MRTVAHMELNTSHYANRLSNLSNLSKLASFDTPVVQLDGSAVRLRFSFDEDHDWLDVDDLIGVLSHDDDKDLLRSVTYGGRLASPEFFLDMARYRRRAGLVYDEASWDAMMSKVHPLTVFDQSPQRSYQYFADATLYLMHTLAGYQHDGEFTVEVVRRGQAACANAATAVDWVSPDIEMYLRNLDQTVDHLEMFYPGAGSTATLTATHSDGSSTELDIIVARTKLVADIFAAHHACDGVAVLDELNSLSDDEAAEFDASGTVGHSKRLVVCRESAGDSVGSLFRTYLDYYAARPPRL